MEYIKDQPSIYNKGKKDYWDLKKKTKLHEE